MEVLTWSQLGFHQKPIGILNIAGFFDPMLVFLERLSKEEFITPEHKSMLIVDDKPERLLHQFSEYTPPLVDKAKRALKLSKKNA